MCEITFLVVGPSKLNVVLEKSLKMVAIFRMNPVLDQLPILASSFQQASLCQVFSPQKTMDNTTA